MPKKHTHLRQVNTIDIHTCTNCAYTYYFGIIIIGQHAKQ